MKTFANKHLSLENRKTIESLLNNNVNFSHIANVIGKHRTTIAREVYTHRVMKEPRRFNRGFSDCIFHNNCADKTYPVCRIKCNNYKESFCKKTLKAPYVCNGCFKKQNCFKRRFFYDYSIAQNEYNELLIDSRNSIHLTKSQINDINSVIKPLIANKNQSVNQVFISHPEILNMSKTTFYKYVDSGLIDIKNIDLQRKVKLKYKKIKDIRIKRDPQVKEGRTYKDFLKYISENPDASIVEMDTVIGTSGSKGGKCMLTLLFRSSKLMLIFLLPYKKTTYVTEAFIYIKSVLGIECFKNLFEVILTDNGSEFLDPLSIEVDFETGEKISNLFYCDSNCSWQKGTIEKNHEYIRYVLPKGTSFANLTQEDCNILASNINNVPRNSLNKKTPYEVFVFLNDKNILDKLRITYINPEEVNLTKDIFNK